MSYRKVQMDGKFELPSWQDRKEAGSIERSYFITFKSDNKQAASFLPRDLLLISFFFIIIIIPPYMSQSE